MASVGELLSSAAARLRESGSESPRLDAEVLLAAILNTDRTRLMAHPETPIGDASVDLLFHRWRGTTSAEVLRKVGDLSVTIRL